MMRADELVRRAAAVLVFALFAACTGTETDNPVAEGPPPTYTSPIGFGGDDDVPPGCPSPASVGRPRTLPLWGRDGTRLIGADPYRGLLVVDAREPLLPTLQSVTPLAGRVHQLLAQSGGAVTVALDEVPVVQGHEVLDPLALEPVTRLLRFDVGEDGAARRVTDVQVEGELWQMAQRGSTLWVTSALLADPRASCDRPTWDCGYVDYAALVVAGYSFDGASFQRTQRVELPMSTHAWMLPNGFAALVARQDANGDELPASLHFVRFEGDDTLGVPSMVGVPGGVVPGSPLGLTDELAQLFVFDSTIGDAALVTVALDDGAVLSRVEPLGQQQFEHAAFAGGRAFVSAPEGQGSPARMIDFADPSAPVVHALPAELDRVEALDGGARALGLGTASGGAPRLALFSVVDDVPQQTSELVLDQPALQGANLAEVHLGTDRVLLEYVVAEGRSTTTVAVDLAGDALELRQIFALPHAQGLIELDDAVFAIGYGGLSVGQLSDGQTHSTSWTRDVRDIVAVGEYQATLVSDRGAPPTLEISKDDTVLASLPAGPFPQRLFVAGERVVVLSLEPKDQCEQSGLDCSDYAPNAAVVALGDAPALLATLPLPEAEPIVDGEGSASLYWDTEGQPALPLGGGRLLLVADYDGSCNTQRACAALGVELKSFEDAHVSPALPDTPPPSCAPGGPCEALPPNPPTSEATGYGSLRTQRLFVLDAAADPPRLAAAVESVLELPDSSFAAPRVSEGIVLVTRIEREGQPVSTPASAPPSGRFMLDRFVLGDDGELSALPSVNVPGYPVALADGGALAFTVEPDAERQGAARLHVLSLEDDIARSLSSLRLEGRYGEIVAAFGKAYYVRRSGEGCMGSTTLLPIVLPQDADTALRALPELQLPGLYYRITDAADERLLLTDERGHGLVLEVSGADAPSLSTFFSARVASDSMRLDGDSVLGAAGLYGVQRLTF